jgi:ATP-dependent exoDNAse (exonuclease V) alpha subunit
MPTYISQGRYSREAIPNPPASVERFGWRFAPGDWVMQTENDYEKEVFNGDLGSVIRIETRRAL